MLALRTFNRVIFTLGAIGGALSIKYLNRNPLVICLITSVFSYYLTKYIIPASSQAFIKANLKGTDMNKREKPVLPETMGLISAVVYLITIYLFLPFPFAKNFSFSSVSSTPIPEPATDFPHIEFNQFLSGLLSIQAMILLGFADDAFDIRWRHKVLLPAVASIPLLIVYFISQGVTYVVVPYPFREYFPSGVDLGVLYYIYMGMVAIFCTNAINILAGVNGVEVGQSVVITISLIIFNIFHLNDSYEETVAKHLFSLYMLVPFLAVSLPLLGQNWYPAKVFVGDTYCYFAGMVFAVVGILGHFSKTLLLFFGPQIFNFIFSAPQLFGLIPCPRHRMPRINLETGNLEAAKADLSKLRLKKFQILVIEFAELIGLIWVERIGPDSDPEPEVNHNFSSMTNFTILSAILVRYGPMPEEVLTKKVLIIQTIWSLLAFLIRYQLVSFFYYN